MEVPPNAADPRNTKIKKEGTGTGTGSENLVFGTGTLNLAKFRVYREFTPYRSRAMAETEGLHGTGESTSRLWDPLLGF